MTGNPRLFFIFWKDPPWIPSSDRGPVWLSFGISRVLGEMKQQKVPVFLGANTTM